MGHALVASALPGTDPVHKVSIIPRGIGALGYTMQRPTEDRFLISTADLKNKMTVLMGGRAAEALIYNEISTGAADDLDRATEIARQMVTRFGMTEADFGELAQLMADVIRYGKDVKEEVCRFRQRFLDLQYCFSGKEFEKQLENLQRLV